MRIETIFPPEIINNASDIQVTMYMNTHMTAPDNKADRIQFKNLMNDVLSKIDERKIRDSIQLKLSSIYDDESFWIHNLHGLAVLVDEMDMSVYKVNRKFDNQVSVSSNFDLRQLLRHFQSDDEYFILALANDYFNVYKGNRYSLDEFEFSLPILTRDEVLGTEISGRTLNVGNYGGVGSANYHGHNTRSEEEKIDLQRYYLYIDRFIEKNLDNQAKLPIILLGLAEQLGEFRKITNNASIIEDGIEVSLESVENDNKLILSKAWPLVESLLVRKTDQLLSRFNVNKENDLASSDVAEIAYALIEDRVDTLVIEDGKSFKNIYRALSDYDKNMDVLNIFIQHANKSDCSVVMLPKEKMPTDSGAFAIFRYIAV